MDAFPIPTSTLNASSRLKKCLGNKPKDKGELNILVGEKKGSYYIDLAKAGHLLVTGWVQSGKERVIKTILSSLLFNFNPSELRLILYDSEGDFEDLLDQDPYTLTPIIHDSETCTRALRWAKNEMQQRYTQFIEKKVSTFEEYNAQADSRIVGKKLRGMTEEKKPRIVVILKTVDTLPKELKMMIEEFVFSGAKVGIHLILVTHSLLKGSLLPGTISNLPNRIACPITNDMEGLEVGIPDARYLKENELFVLSQKSKPVKINRVDVSKDDIQRISGYIKKNYTMIHYSEALVETVEESEGDDPLYKQALQHVFESGKASTAYLQRMLKIGYSRAAALIDLMEQQGYIGPAKGDGNPRSLLKKDDDTINKPPLSLLSKGYGEDIVPLRGLIEQYESADLEYKLPIILGVNEQGLTRFADLTKAPHILMAGTTGSGKSVFESTIITTLLLSKSPEYFKFILIDPKRVCLSEFQGIPHLQGEIITEAEDAVTTLYGLVEEMQIRYKKLAAVRAMNIVAYNHLKGIKNMPYIVCVIDELADLMMSGKKNAEAIEAHVIRLAQLSRAVGIHMIMGTQRPSEDIIPGMMKANMSTRISFSVSSIVDSEVILDMKGAEALRGKGDMLCLFPDMATPMRVQAPYISQEDVMKVIHYLKK